MTERLTEVRRYGHDKTRAWIVDILGEMAAHGYVRPNGIAGRCFEYKNKGEAVAAETMYLAKKAGEHIGVETSAEDQRQPIKIRTFDTKETNPKDVIGMKKAPISTLSCPVLFEMGLGMLEGARKYGRHNYRAMGVSATVYYDAAMGHLMDWFEGEDIDPDSGLNHVTKAMTALLVLRDSMLMGNWVDDRPLRNPNKLYKKYFNPKAKAIIEKYPDCVEPYLETNKELDRTKPVPEGY